VDIISIVRGDGNAEIKNHNPRKGTETNPSNLQRFLGLIFKNHNPRKGAETSFPLER